MAATNRATVTINNQERPLLDTETCNTSELPRPRFQTPTPDAATSRPRVSHHEPAPDFRRDAMSENILIFSHTTSWSTGRGDEVDVEPGKESALSACVKWGRFTRWIFKNRTSSVQVSTWVFAVGMAALIQTPDLTYNHRRDITAPHCLFFAFLFAISQTSMIFLLNVVEMT